MPAPNSNYQYIGWVPCVSGRLFFEYTECGLGDAHAIAVNHSDPVDDSSGYIRYVLISSRVDWKDIKNDNTTGKYQVILAGQKHADEIVLTGNVYLIPVANGNPVLTTAENMIAAISSAARAGGEVGSSFKKLTTHLDGSIGASAYKVEFVVESPGFVKLKHVAAESRSSDEADFLHELTLTRQAYYYIKYALHKHQHHHDKAESLTTIHPLSGDNSNVGIKLLNDLRKSLVQIKRDAEDFDCDNLFRAVGIASYAKSLAESCYRAGYLSEADYRSELSYFDNITASVKIMADATTRELTRSATVAGNARAIVLFALSIIGPLLLVYRDSIKEHVAQNEVPRIVMHLAEALGTDSKIALIAVSLLAFYWIYMAVTMRFGRFFLAFKWYRAFINAVVHDTYKAGIIAVVLVPLSLFVILFALARLLAA